jgi:hypothetical protein
MVEYEGEGLYENIQQYKQRSSTKFRQIFGQNHI